MYFSLQMVHVPSVGQAGNNPQLPSSQLKLNIYVALSSATQEATCTCTVYVAMLFNERSSLGRQVNSPTTIYEDKQMKTTKEPLSWQRMPKTTAKLSTLTFAIILFEKELFLMKLKYLLSY